MNALFPEKRSINDSVTLMVSEGHSSVPYWAIVLLRSSKTILSCWKSNSDLSLGTRATQQGDFWVAHCFLSVLHAVPLKDMRYIHTSRCVCKVGAFFSLWYTWVQKLIIKTQSKLETVQLLKCWLSLHSGPNCSHQNSHKPQAWRHIKSQPWWWNSNPSMRWRCRDRGILKTKVESDQERHPILTPVLHSCTYHIHVNIQMCVHIHIVCILTTKLQVILPMYNSIGMLLQKIF